MHAWLWQCRSRHNNGPPIVKLSLWTGNGSRGPSVSSSKNATDGCATNGIDPPAPARRAGGGASKPRSRTCGQPGVTKLSKNVEWTDSAAQILFKWLRESHPLAPSGRHCEFHATSWREMCTSFQTQYSVALHLDFLHIPSVRPSKVDHPTRKAGNASSSSTSAFICGRGLAAARRRQRRFLQHPITESVFVSFS